MKRIQTLAIATLVGALLAALGSPEAMADKGRSKQGSSIQSHSNFQGSAGLGANSAGQHFQFPKQLQQNGNLQPRLNSGNLKQFNGQLGRSINPSIKNGALNKAIGSGALSRATGNGSLANSLTNGSIPRNLANGALSHAIGGGGLTKTAGGSLAASYPKLASAFSNHPVTAGCLAGVHFEPKHCYAPLTPTLWCFYHPTCCHWWWDCCPNLHACLPVQYCYWNWYYVSCPQVVYYGGVQVHAKWYLGLSGMVLPATGLGIDSVAAGSPAEQAGLKPGMVIKSINGIELVSQAEMERAMATPDGLLNMVVTAAADQDPISLSVQMVLVSSVSY